MSSRGEFIRALAHDLINPLSSIGGFLQLLLDPDAKDPLTHRQRRMMVAADQASTYLLGLVRDVSDLSLIEEKGWAPRKEPVDLRATAEKVFREYRVLAESRRIRLTVEAAPEVGPVPADERMMERLFDALLRTAGRLTPEGGEITLRLAVASDGAGRKRRGEAARGAAGRAGAAGGVSLVMEHTGEGYPRGALDKLLRSTLGGARPAGGYGQMGLALCRRIVALHGGALDAGPRPEGGTTFTLHIPA